MVANETAGEVDADAYTPTETDRNWMMLLDATLGERLGGLTVEYRLSEAAAKRFLDFHAQLLRRGTSDSRKLIAWWPKQLLKITLLLHLSLLRQEVPVEIELTAVEAAIALIERLGTAQLRLAGASTTARNDLETEIELMVAKAHLHTGPLTKRDLFHKYNDQRYERHEPVLARCCEQGRLRLEGNLIVPVLPD